MAEIESATQERPEPSAWNPEDAAFWARQGKRVAWQTLVVTTFCLILAFATWFMVSAIVTKLSGIGFKFTTQQLFWINAMPGLAAGLLRTVHTFLIPILGTRKTVSVSTLLLVVPCFGWGFIVQDQTTPYWVFLLFAFLAGLGGGNFSSFMPSTSLFFPKRLQGTSLGIQAGIGNFGVSITQFVVPWIIGFALLGSTLGTAQTLVTKKPDGSVVESSIWLQNAAFVWVPFVVAGTIAAWFLLRRIPVKATFREQLDIFGNKHTWIMTSLYFMTFGSFSGYAAAFPLLIKELYGKFPGAPQPLKYAFLGPLVGALVRALAGPLSDWLGGGRVTLISAVGLLACAIGVVPFAAPTSVAQFDGFLWLMLGLFLFSGIGNASTFKQMPMIFERRQASGVIGFTSAMASFGPFVFSVSFGAIIASTGSASAFFIGAAVFYGLNLVANWWFYTRKGASKPC